MQLALNHICAPKLSLEAFFAMSRRLGVEAVEIRNDIPDVVNSHAPGEVRRAASEAGVRIVSINALYPFNVWSGDLPDRARALADYAAECGAEALVMCPLNDGTRIAQGDLVHALGEMAGVLRERGLAGLVEPLGFPISSLRRKAEALAAIDVAGGDDVYRLLHDTFHHHLAGETAFFPERTGLVHISGLTDPGVRVEDMLDAHRVLVDGADRLENLPQLRALLAAGYAGPVSFEPFASEVHDLDDPEAALRATMEFVTSGVTEAA
ncbi:TIM barrel protein [Limimaricola cinnabarinus]|uniref:Inosose isomerase n=1 Tax=Limimaricola cinnabarinus LL-001 TaxID=1337093 RepID=U3AKU7_9RHOB|nr:TIM barrel protein [Limimaricola cinnabarinus]GAD55363.1 inosose isomerase [Limimaricola cinnabarinus LL-001]